MWGKQTYSDKSSARDSGLLALITYGEGYHNFYHTFQWDYRNGIRWWHFDPTKWMIQALSWIGLTRDLKRTSHAQIETARLNMQYRQATARIEGKQIPDQWREKLEQEYEQFLTLLNQWNDQRQAWYEAKGKRLQESLANWERMQVRDRYRELQYQLKAQKRRWREMMRALRDPMLLPA